MNSVQTQTMARSKAITFQRHRKRTEGKSEEILPPENDHGIAARDLLERKASETEVKPIKIDSPTIKESVNERPDEKSKGLSSNIAAG